MKGLICRFAVVGMVCVSAVALAQQHGVVHGRDGITLPPPPVATAKPVTDNYFGTKVVDDYRWLENATSPETLKWITAENAYTQKYLDQVKILPEIRKQLTALQRVEVESVPTLRAGKYFFEKRLPDENQASIYVRDGWNGKDVRLIDATKLSKDQDTSVHIWDISDDGDMMIYAVRQGGADEAVLHFLRVKERTELPDVLPSARYFGASLSPDGKGVYYSKFTHEGTTVWLHQFGTPVSADKKIFGGEYKGQKLGELDLVEAYVTDNHRYLMIHIGHGVPATEDDILVKDLRNPASDLVPLVYGVKAHFDALNIGDRFFLKTDYQAPNGKIVEAKPGEQPSSWKTVIPEYSDVIDSDSIVGGKLFVSRLHD